MLNIGDKIYRNLQEQVGFNSERIEEILKVLDGIGVYDNVIAIADISHVLTPAEIAIADKEVAFIIYNDQIYIKRTETAGIAYFDVIFTIAISTVISFNSKEIEANLTTGALTLTTTTASTYSTTDLDTQIGAKADVTYVDTQLALKADLAGATFTGDVTAPKLLQTQANASASFNYDAVTGLTITNIYSRVEQIGNILYIVGNIKVENTTGSNISYLVQSGSMNLGSYINERIFDVTGKKISESGTMFTRICDFPVIMSESAQIGLGSTTLKTMTAMRSSTQYTISVRTLSGQELTIPANTTRYISFRVFLTLL